MPFKVIDTLLLRTGVPGKIQCSQVTADLLVRAGKGHWVKPREDDVLAKGKGVLKTFWLIPTSKKGDSSTTSESALIDGIKSEFITANKGSDGIMKHERLVGWMVQIFKENIRAIVAQHAAAKKNTGAALAFCARTGEIPLDELVEAIKLPEFDATIVTADTASVVIPDNISNLLREFVSIVSPVICSVHEFTCYANHSLTMMLSLLSYIPFTLILTNVLDCVDLSK